ASRRRTGGRRLPNAAPVVYSCGGGGAALRGVPRRLPRATGCHGDQLRLRRRWRSALVAPATPSADLLVATSRRRGGFGDPTRAAPLVAGLRPRHTTGRGARLHRGRRPRRRDRAEFRPVVVAAAHGGPVSASR